MSAVSDLFDKPDVECGTMAGYVKHWHTPEPACAECVEAWQEHMGQRGRRVDRRQVIERMKALDTHRAARAALQEQMRVDL